MNLRALFAAVALAVFAAPSAHAAVGDALLPLVDADDGVTVSHTKTGEVQLRFGPKAAKLYKTIAGKHADVGCGGEDGHFGSNPDDKLPKRRGTLRMWTGGADLDFCAISTRKTKADARCLPPDSRSNLCVRVIVTLTDAGRAYFDAKARTFELGVVMSVWMFSGSDLAIPGKTPLEQGQRAFGPDIVALDSPDGSPPAGKVGLWANDKNVAVVVLLQDGTRRFVRMQDGVYSTNDLHRTMYGDEEFTLL